MKAQTKGSDNAYTTCELLLLHSQNTQRISSTVDEVWDYLANYDFTQMQQVYENQLKLRFTRLGLSDPLRGIKRILNQNYKKL